MKVTTKSIDKANLMVNASFSKEEIDARVDKLAVQAGKQMKVDGFRKGKVPVGVVKKLHGEQLTQDAEGELTREALDQALIGAKVDKADILGDPMFKKYDKTDAGVEANIQVCLRPTVELGEYQKSVPSFEYPDATDEELEKRIDDLSKKTAALESIKRKRALKKDDTAVFDFEGFLDGEPFEGGKADDFELEIGSGQFIPGFEEQMIGMKPEDEKKIKITFPEDYQAENLKGKETEFAIKLKDIKVKAEVEINDEMAQKVTGKADATVEDLKSSTVDQIVNEKISKLYNDELKPKLLETLVEKYNFDLPENIVEQEIDNLVNGKAQAMKPEEVKEIQSDSKKLETLREETREDAVNSVKATFIVDAMARAEKVSVDDQEVYQALYYEALMAGQKPEEVVEHYKKNNLIPAIKMGMIEDKLFGKLLGLDKKLK
ncbi:MAG: trigger factor [Sulfurovum sp.]|nr:trigger factor [Sulfurovum sp.]